MKRNVLLVIMVLLCSMLATGQQLISEKLSIASFALVQPGAKIFIYTDSSDFNTVQMAASLLADDIKRVAGQQATIVHAIPAKAASLIIIGSVNNASVIRQLLQSGKISNAKITGQWEAYQLQTISRPFKGIENVLVITGSDRRGVAYGVFELSKQIGVSPWYWWADVPVKKKTSLYVNKSVVINDQPKVKYRGIFINDEAPALSGWTKEKFGGFNSKFYAKVFELILRLKGNYIWPAMWGNAFYDDDSLSINVANEYGIVIGTSHHEPLMRAHVEWKRYGSGKWNYDSNEVRLKEFWKLGMQRATNEKIVSVGMRGDGDEPMSRETATALLERIVKDQRQIIEDVTKKPASETPQLWALYKEVQDYYDKGMRVPDDVTLLLCDDNWGNIRKLPAMNAPPRKGGYGIYYHFDYVGDPRNYKWVNTNPIPRVWEQMHLAYEHKVKDIWIVNVGDIKPMEFPISFFLDYAWNPDKIDAADIKRYTENWCADQFGKTHAVEIADILAKYAKYNGRRKPELLDENTYSFNNDELRQVTIDYTTLLQKTEKINKLLPVEYKDAFFELVLHPVMACSNLQELYAMAAMNKRSVAKKDSMANIFAGLVKFLYEKDSLITLQYHRLADGKWNHMMSQTHIGYTYWQQPDFQKMPSITYLPEETQRNLNRPVILTTASALSKKRFVDFNSGHPSEIGTIGKGFQSKANIFSEKDGYVSIEADHFTKAINSDRINWKILPDLGRTGSAVTTFPVTSTNQTPRRGSPQLQYEIYVYDSGNVKVNAYFSPTLNFNNDEGLKYAVSIDDEAPQIVVLNKEDNQPKIWSKWVADNVIIKTTEHVIGKPGKHVLKYWMVSPAVVLQKLVLDLGGLKESYLGPPETRSGR